MGTLANGHMQERRVTVVLRLRSTITERYGDNVLAARSCGVKSCQRSCMLFTSTDTLRKAQSSASTSESPSYSPSRFWKGKPSVRAISGYHDANITVLP